MQPAGKNTHPKPLDDYDRMSDEGRAELQKRVGKGHYAILRSLAQKRGPEEATPEEGFQTRNAKRRKAIYEESDSSNSGSSSEGGHEDDEEDQQDDSDNRVTRQTRYTHHFRSDIEDTDNSPVVDAPFTFEPDNGLEELRHMLLRQQSEINELKRRQGEDITTLRDNLSKNERRLDQLSSVFTSTTSKIEGRLERQCKILQHNTQASLEFVTKLDVKEFAKMAVKGVLDEFPLDQEIKDAVVAQFEIERHRSVVFPTKSAKSQLIVPVSGIVVSSGTENDPRLDAPENDSNLGSDDAPLQSSRRTGSPTPSESNAPSVIRGEASEDERPVTTRLPAVTSGDLSIANTTTTNALDSAKGEFIIPRFGPSPPLKDTAKTDSLLTTPTRQTTRSASPFPSGYTPKNNGKARLPSFGLSQPLKTTIETDSLPATPTRQTTRSAGPFTGGYIPSKRSAMPSRLSTPSRGQGTQRKKSGQPSGITKKKSASG
ncbi:hypothetical protein FOIG_00803 [Fusarium odoratissimum NRRL 54006]|uniref:Uncharacterized protein n=1 Tax=Fusarium odoratissimum (strain NRRL 54006) TaxID=1089451 RepID=X0KBD7_FUSO5|nr:uncharacterized protein FOIG_00803 [Fusarium odoratissimum NRRL 54006]EXM10904.1 hypothetical protein FOIG_00803 [Fusarium odoratissimum NRRL 54006]